MSLLDTLIPKAQKADKIIVLPEGNDPRVMQAAQKIAKQEIAKVIVLATAEEAEIAGKDVSFAGLGVTVLDHTKSTDAEKLAEAFQQLRAHKGVTIELAREKMLDRLYFANMMLRTGMVHGMVAGSIASTGDMVRSAFQCVGTAPGIKIGSSCFAMELATPAPAGDEILFYADCGVNINPTAPQLVDIALATVKTKQALVGGDARVAFLSFSTRGSASHPLVDKMSEATKLMKQRVAEENLDIIVDGELQADAALVPSVAAKKCADSPLQGKANILIFPDLQVGNVCYKITERLAGAKAYGPVLQGLGAPINDLSRGCSVDDIVGVAAITVCQSIG